MTNKTNDQPIGILDSGVGGLSIWQEVVKELPHESILYLADTARCPYGSRSQEEITRFARQMVAFLIKKGVKLIVVGCNTITVTCLARLREEFPDIAIVGTVPVIKTAASLTTGPIGILSTKTTAQSTYQKELIQRFASGRQVVTVGTDELVPLVERGEVDGQLMKQVLTEVLAPFKKAQVLAIALGCSHFPFLKHAIQKEMGESVHVLDSGAAIARQVRRVLETNASLASGKASYTFYTTGDKQSFTAVIERLLPRVAISEGAIEEVVL